MHIVVIIAIGRRKELKREALLNLWHLCLRCGENPYPFTSEACAHPLFGISKVVVMVRCGDPDVGG